MLKTFLNATIQKKRKFLAFQESSVLIYAKVVKT